MHIHLPLQFPIVYIFIYLYVHLPVVFTFIYLYANQHLILPGCSFIKFTHQPPNPSIYLYAFQPLTFSVYFCFLTYLITSQSTHLRELPIINMHVSINNLSSFMCLLRALWPTTSHFICLSVLYLNLPSYFPVDPSS